jgi:hypothetical protein
MSDNIYNDLINNLPEEVKVKYSEKIKNLDKLTFIDLVNILKECSKNGKIINYDILNSIIKDRNIDSFEALEMLFDSTDVISNMNLEERFTIFNKIACSEYKSIISLYNLLFMYKVLYEFKTTNNMNELNRYLTNTNYFNKIIFLKFLLFFQKLNTFLKKKSSRELLKDRIIKIKDELKTKSLQEDASFLETLFDMSNVSDIYNIVINNIENPISQNIEQYKMLFNYNTNTNAFPSSKKASFFVGFHGTLMLINEKDRPYKYLTIKSPEGMTSNLYRWGERGEPTMMFQSMKYSWKQYLISKKGPITKDTLEKLFELTLAENKKEYNYQETQTTIPTTTNNNIIRIKHYSVDSGDYMSFDSNYKMPPKLVSGLKKKISQQNNIKDDINRLNWLTEPVKTSERIIELNCLLLNNNIEFNVFDDSCCDLDDVGNNWVGLYIENPESTRPKLQSYLRKYHFPLELFMNPEFYIQDFVLERDIYALEDMNFNIKIGNKEVQFTLNKGDSFVCNPYIIEYFIENFNSIITIRPGYIINNAKNKLLEENSQFSVDSNSGKTITCPSRGLSCYKVTLASLTNYEMLQFCKDANIKTCDLYDTSCQSFEYIGKYGNFSFENDDKTNRQLAKRMKTIDETTVLKYSPRINKLLFDFEDLSRDRRFTHIPLVFENVPINEEVEIEVNDSPKEPPAINNPIPVSCIEEPEEPEEPVSPPLVCSNVISCNDPMSTTCNNSKSILCTSTSKIPCNSIFNKLSTLCNNYYSNSNYGEILKQLLIPRYNIKTSRENVKRKIGEINETTETEYPKLAKLGGKKNKQINKNKQIKKNTHKYKKNIKTRKHKKYSNKKKCKTRTKKIIKTRKNKKK